MENPNAQCEEKCRIGRESVCKSKGRSVGNPPPPKTFFSGPSFLKLFFAKVGHEKPRLL